MTDTQLSTEWKRLMAPIAAGYATPAMVSAFDRFTSQCQRADIITWEQFIGAQTIIREARKAAPFQKQLAG